MFLEENADGYTSEYVQKVRAKDFNEEENESHKIELRKVKNK